MAGAVAAGAAAGEATAGLLTEVLKPGAPIFRQVAGDRAQFTQGVSDHYSELGSSDIMLW